MSAEAKKKQHSDEKPLKKMTVKELRAIAMELPHSGAVHDLKKEELIEFVRQARGIKVEKEKKKVKKDLVKIILTKEQIKANIRELKKKKQEIKESRERKQIDILRRRISHLKKLSRRVATVR